VTSQAEPVVIDTAAFFALVSSEDEFHDLAAMAYRDMVDEERRLLTTSYVLVETQALIHRRLGFDVLKTLVESIAGIVDVVWVSASAHDQAWPSFEDRRGVGLSLVDWTVALAARQSGASVFSFDSGFSEEGLELIPSQT